MCNHLIQSYIYLSYNIITQARKLCYPNNIIIQESRITIIRIPRRAFQFNGFIIEVILVFYGTCTNVFISEQLSLPFGVMRLYLQQDIVVP